MRPFTIRYRFEFEGGQRSEFTLELDRHTLFNLAPPPAAFPEWTRLSVHRCGNCPLDPARHAYCPAAHRLIEPVSRFRDTLSFTNAEVHVAVPEREMVSSTTVQTGLASLLGIYLTTSGCPVLGRLRPMVRFHLPFASPVETLYRAASNYLLGQHLRSKAGLKADWALEGLVADYRAIAEVNRGLARRLREAAPKDASVNALVILDMFAKALPDSIEDGLSELKPLFSDWMR